MQQLWSFSDWIMLSSVCNSAYKQAHFIIQLLSTMLIEVPISFIKL